MLALWAEMNVIVADQFRDGNVPALQDPLAVGRRALPEEYLSARPKCLRFLIFNTVGRIVHHARRVVCRIAGTGWRDWVQLMPLPAS